METIINPDRRDWPQLVRRDTEADQVIASCVERIVERVRAEGDRALAALAEEIDGVRLRQIEVPAAAIAASAEKVAPQLREAIGMAAQNIRRFHEAQLARPVEVETSPGVRCMQRAVPIRRVGIYIPGGTAPLFSTVLMLAIPAQVAGCREVILCTPPSPQGEAPAEILYATSVCGVDRVFLSGGAQAIAAMAYGTQSIPPVDKIFGPGNRYVTRAKQLVSVSQTAIDMPAGPSEVMILADSSARAEFVAADMLSQAEHGGDSQAIAVVDSCALAERVRQEVETQAAGLSRAEATRKALGNSRIIVLEERNRMIDFANEYAAEHLIISMREPWEVCAQIESAGSIFIGNWSPESAGDYASGTNHTLPTAGWARAYGGVNTDSFMKKMTVQELSREGLAHLGGTITTMALAEGLDAHANAVEVRLKG